MNFCFTRSVIKKIFLSFGIGFDCFPGIISNVQLFCANKKEEQIYVTSKSKESQVFFVYPVELQLVIVLYETFVCGTGTHVNNFRAKLKQRLNIWNIFIIDIETKRVYNS